MSIPLIHDNLLFFGDSITDCGRDRTTPDSLGNGYVALIAAWLGCHSPAPHRRVLNQGIGGNRIYDLEARLERDVLAHAPNLVTLLIGINDTWRRYDSKVVSPPAEFAASYRRVLQRITAAHSPRLVLMEPFLLPVPPERRVWREDLDPKIAIVRDLAVEFGANLIALDGLFTAASSKAPAGYWLPDGVHPSPAGHALIAHAWLNQFDSQ